MKNLIKKTLISSFVFTTGVLVFGVIGLSVYASLNKLPSGSKLTVNMRNNLIDQLWQRNGLASYYNTGNVGIGTDSPSEKLEVNGNIKATRFIGEITDTGKTYFNAYSTASSLSWNSTSRTAVHNVFAWTDGINNGITRSGSTFTFSKDGTYYISFESNSWARNNYRALRLRKINGSGGTLLKFTSHTNAQNAADGDMAQHNYGLHGLFNATAGDQIILEYVVYGPAGTAPSTWGNSSQPIDGDVTAQLSIFQIN